MRKFLTIEGIHHLKAVDNRLYIKRQNGGRGLVKLESTYNAVIFLSECKKPGKDRLTRKKKKKYTGKIKYSLCKKKLI
jgi:hypothetical protein